MTAKTPRPPGRPGRLYSTCAAHRHSTCAAHRRAETLDRALVEDATSTCGCHTCTMRPLGYHARNPTEMPLTIPQRRAPTFILSGLASVRCPARPGRER